MAKPFYQRFDQPDGLSNEALKLLEKCYKKDINWVRKGTNETTKSIEKGHAKLVYIALDVDPPEIVGHLPLLCEEKKIPYVYVSSKKDLGKGAGIEVPMASATITEFGDFSKEGDNISSRVRELAKMK